MLAESMLIWMEVYILSKKDGHLLNMLQRFFGEEPQDVMSQHNAAACMYQDMLLRDCFAIFDIENAPEDWNMEYVKRNIFRNGYLIISDTAMGVLPLRGSISGYNVWEEPSEFQVVNPVLTNAPRGIIGQDGVVLRLQYDYSGIQPLLDYYSFLLAVMDGAIAVNAMTAKSTFFAECNDDAQAKSFKLAFDDMMVGKPGVFIKKGMGAQMWQNKPRESFVGNELIMAKQRIRNEFLSVIGVNNTNVDKKERMVTDEVNANTQELVVNTAHWKEMLTTGIEEANKMFGLSMRVVFPFAEQSMRQADLSTRKSEDASGNGDVSSETSEGEEGDDGTQ